MENICLAHQKPLNVIDLTLHETICERCALFVPTYKRHQFIEAEKLSQHAQGLLSTFEDQLKTLKIEQKEQKM